MCDSQFPLVVHPSARLVSHDLTVTHEGYSSQSHEVRDRVLAEVERLMRLSPSPPVGYYWDMDIRRFEDLPNDTVTFRVVVTLREIP